MRIRFAVRLAAAAALAGACQPATQEMTEAQRTAVADSVRATNAALWALFPTGNVDSVMSYYVADQRLTVAELGMVYPTRDSMIAAARAFWGGIRSATVNGAEPAITVLALNAAVVTEAFEGTLTDTTGATMPIRGVWSGVYEHTGAGWKIVQSHESWPAPAPAPAPARRR